jgi:DNA-binding winged helix-turn-helix (wHTH) protein/predicted ATPase
MSCCLSFFTGAEYADWALPVVKERFNLGSIIVFPPFRLDMAEQRLWRGEEILQLRPKTFAVLAYLLERPGQLVTKEELLDACWPDTVMTYTVLKVCIREIREALGDDPKAPRFIETEHRRGYRFIGRITEDIETEKGREGETERRRDGETERGEHFSLRPSVSPSLCLSVSPAATELVGREAELARLRESLERALEGQRQVVFVTGEAGIGKTALLEAFLLRAAADPRIWVARGQCLEQFGSGEAYLPALEAVSRLCQETGRERFIALLRRHAPTWLLQMPWLLSEGEIEALRRKTHGTRERMLREIAEAIEALTDETALVLALEDLHWSDYSTLDLISYLARRRERARLLVIGVYRSVEAILQEHPLRSVKQDLQMKRLCEELALGYLSEAAVGEYLTRRFPQSALPEAFPALIHERTRGNPLFMVSVVDYLEADGLIAECGGQWRLSVELAEIELGVPEGVRQMIEKQLDRLSQDQRQALEAASVAGAEFDVGSVAACLEKEVMEIEEMCEEMARRHQFLREAPVVELPDGTTPARYGFMHSLYQNVLYQRVAEARRARLHLMMGERGERIYGEQAGDAAAELAMHFERGRDYRRAVRYLRQAAENAVRRFANHEAIALARRGLDLLSSLPETAERTQSELPLQVTLGVTLMATRGYAAAEVEQAYARARELCRQIGETPRLFPVLWGLARFYIVRTPLQTALELAEQLLRIAERERDPYLLMHACNPLADCLFHLGEFIQARAYQERGLAIEFAPPERLFDASYVDDPRVVCRARLASTLWCLGYPDQGLKRCREAIEMAEELGHPFTLVVAQVFAATFHFLRRDYQSTRELAEASLAISVQHDFNELMMHARFMLGCALVEEGQVAEGAEHILWSANVAQNAGVEIWRPSVFGLLAQACGKSGQIEKALSLFDESLAAAARSNERFAEAELYRLKGELLLDCGLRIADCGLKEADAPSNLQSRSPNPQSAIRNPQSEVEDCFHQAVEIARRQEAKSLELRAATSLARLRLRQGRRSEARQSLLPVYEWFTEGFDTADLKDARALLDELS